MVLLPSVEIYFPPTLTLIIWLTGLRAHGKVTGSVFPSRMPRPLWVLGKPSSSKCLLEWEGYLFNKHLPLARKFTYIVSFDPHDTTRQIWISALFMGKPGLWKVLRNLVMISQLTRYVGSKGWIFPVQWAASRPEVICWLSRIREDFMEVVEEWGVVFRSEQWDFVAGQ